MKSKTCCFTGHRKIPETEKPLIKERLLKAVTTLIDQGYLYFGAGGALGFDTLAAEVILDLKNTYPQIKLILVLPCYNQTLNWQFNDIAKFEEIKSKSDKVVYVSKQYTPNCMQKRNLHLVNNSSACICYLTKSTGGTAYTIKYAQSRGLLILNVADNTSHYL